jgi:hypothetical protein
MSIGSGNDNLPGYPLAKLYSITANAYMLEFVGIIKKISFGLINVVPKDASGNPVKDMGKVWIDIDETGKGYSREKNGWHL